MLKLLTYAKGYSGIRIEVVEKMLEFINKDIIPFVPEKGSVGASGDLAPLAHIALSLIGEGQVFINKTVSSTQKAFNLLNIKPLELYPKEGISLINGTQYSTAIAISMMNQSVNLLQCSDIIGALSVESSLSSREVFNPIIHSLKVHPGQKKSAENIYNILSDSDIVISHKDCGKIQDPYSFRCIPHVHGASRDVVKKMGEIVNNEINSVSDNPLIFSEKDIFSSGHFHAEHIAQAMDSVGIAISEIGSISQKRIHYFMKGIEDKIPQFLSIDPGLQSGYMLAQVTAAALASENKTLVHPASVDNISTSAGQEDFVSMAPWAGQKALIIASNTATILAIELIVSSTAAQIFMRDLNPSSISKVIFNVINPFLDFKKGDRPLNNEIEKIKNLIETYKIVEMVKREIDLN